MPENTEPPGWVVARAVVGSVIGAARDGIWNKEE